MKIENYTPAIVVKQNVFSVRKTETRTVTRIGCFYWSSRVLIIKFGFTGIRLTFKK